MATDYFEDSEIPEKSCIRCKWFTSYADDYCDDLEPYDMGFCRHPQREGKEYHTDASKTCGQFDGAYDNLI